MTPQQAHKSPVQHAEAHIDLTAIRDNVAELKSHARSADVMAVVKADGYGHGLVPAAQAALAGGATWLGTAVVNEALALRESGMTGRIMSWLYSPGERFADALRADIDLSASAVWTVDEIADAARETDTVARLHLKIDSGLGRSGAPRSEWDALVEAALKAQAEGVLEVVGIWSHFAIADEPSNPVNTAQHEAFAEAVSAAEAKGVRPQVRHLANSAATLRLPEAHYDMVRPGIATYGLTPMPSVASSAELGLRPAMRVKANLALVKRVPAEHGVSYGHAYVTEQETTLGLIPLGYADGVPRHASGGEGLPGAPVLAAGRTRRIAGRVCMDQFVLDLGDDAAQAGDEVVFFGDGSLGEPNAQEWADAVGTISYEIVTRFGPRLPRTYTPLSDA